MPDLTSKCHTWNEQLKVEEVFSSRVCAGCGQVAYFVVKFCKLVEYIIVSYFKNDRIKKVMLEETSNNLGT